MSALMGANRDSGAGPAGEDVGDGPDAVDWDLGISGRDEDFHED